MKRVGHIYERIYDLDNIKEAALNASLGKRDHIKVKTIIDDLDYYAKQIKKMLVEKTYVPTKPRVKTIQDTTNGKVRTIHKPKFYPDQIIHWALMLQLQPIFMKGMYEYNCGSVPGRGTKTGQKAIRKWLDKDYKNTKWCLKMDIKKFYPSIDNEVLKGMCRRKIKDPHCLWLVDSIIENNIGQPIGFFTAQWLSNFSLEEMDHFIKERLGVKYYVRYVDDLVLLGSNKRKLHRVKQSVEAYLSSISLALKDNWQVFKVDDRGIDFLGLRFFRDKTILRRQTALRIRRRINKIEKKGYLTEKDASAVISYWGWIKCSDSYRFYHKYMRPVVPIDLAKKVVSMNAKIRNAGGRGVVHKLEATRRI